MAIRDLVDMAVELIDDYRKTAVTLALGTVLTTTTILKDNVHFGSVILNNPQKNQYVWGLLPSVKLRGKTDINLYSFGLFGAVNTVKDNSQVNNMMAYGLIVSNSVEDNSQVNNMRAYVLVSGDNELWNHSRIIGNSRSIGFISEGPNNSGMLTCFEE